MGSPWCGELRVGNRMQRPSENHRVHASQLLHRLDHHGEYTHTHICTHPHTHTHTHTSTTTHTPTHTHDHTHTHTLNLNSVLLIGCSTCFGTRSQPTTSPHTTCLPSHRLSPLTPPV